LKNHLLGLLEVVFGSWFLASPSATQAKNNLPGVRIPTGYLLLIREDLWLLHQRCLVFRFVCGAAALPCEALGERRGGGVQAVGLDFGLGEQVDEARVLIQFAAHHCDGVVDQLCDLLQIGLNLSQLAKECQFILQCLWLDGAWKHGGVADSGFDGVFDEGAVFITLNSAVEGANLNERAYF
jgi:hypothetical protein